MKLIKQEMSNTNFYNDRKYNVFTFNRDEVIEETMKNPKWIHFGAGNIFRAYLASLAQDLMNQGIMNTGIIVAEGFDLEIIEKAYQPYDDLCINAILKSDGTMTKEVIGSVAKSVYLNQCKDDFETLKQMFQNTSLQMATFTITEKGYQLYDANGKAYSGINVDMENGPRHVESYMGLISALLYERFLAGAKPIAMVSMDNCSHNGEKLYNAISTFAKVWQEKKIVENGFYEYVCDNTKVSFPWTMIDKITPRPSELVLESLIKDGFEDMEIIQTKQNSFVAPFVNAEETGYLVIEDSFPNGRPQLESTGVYFTTRTIVEKVERMKVCTCLNPLHTVLAIFGCLLKYDTIYNCMQDDDLSELVKLVGCKEGLKVVEDPKIINPEDFIKQVIEVRFVNPFMPDTPQRIATDTSMKLCVRFGETIKAYAKDPSLDVQSLKGIPFLIAGWCRYLLGIDDEGNEFQQSSDPALKWASECLKNKNLSKLENVHDVLYPILSNQDIFGVDLYELGLNDSVEKYFYEMIQGKNSIRNALQKITKI